LPRKIAEASSIQYSDGLDYSSIERIARAVIVDHVSLGRHERIPRGFQLCMAIIMTGIALIYNAIVSRGASNERSG
jgi:hypothetical protein